MSWPSRTLTVVASASNPSGPPSMLTPDAIACSIQELSAAKALSSHAASRSGAPVWSSMYRIVTPLPNTRQDPGRRGAPAPRPRVRRQAVGKAAVPRAQGAPEAEPQVPQRGGDLTRAHVRGPLLGGAKAVLVLVHLVRLCVKHRSSVGWKFSSRPFGSSTRTTNGIPSDGHPRCLSCQTGRGRAGGGGGGPG